MKKNITEITLPELGYFSAHAIEGLAKKLDDASYMHFQIKSSNSAGNHTLIVRVESCVEYSEEEIRNTFLHLALSMLAFA